MCEKQPILSVNHITKTFTTAGWQKNHNSVKAVNDVSFCVDAGKTLGIVGESGCGKTTLAKIILRLETVDSGSVMFNGHNVLRADKKQLRQIREQLQVVFQDPYASLSPHMTVRRLIAEPLVIAGRPHGTDVILKLMRQVGLQPEDLNRFPNEFSGGQRQRICIARAIALYPSLLICDEPVSALDVSVQSQILNLFKQLQEDLGLTYVFISHDLSVVRHISDQICVMYLGCVVERGSTDEIYQNPRHPYTKTLLNAVLSPDVNRNGLAHIQTQTEPSGTTSDSVGCSFYHRCPYATDVCKTEKPKEYAIGPSHYVACHRFCKPLSGEI